MRLFEYPYNYIGNRVFDTSGMPVALAQVSDNDFNTSTTETVMDVYIDTVGDGSGDAQPFTSFFIKCKGVERYSVAVTDGNLTNVSVTVPTMTSRFTRSITDLRGVQNHLYLYDGTTPVLPNGKVLRFTFDAISGQTVEIIELMVLNQVLAFDEGETRSDRPRFQELRFEKVERASAVQTSITGQVSKAQALNQIREKHRVVATIRYKNRDDLERMLNFKEDYNAFVCAANYELYPSLVFPAIMSNAVTPVRYRTSKIDTSSQTLELTIEER